MQNLEACLSFLHMHLSIVDTQFRFHMTKTQFLILISIAENSIFSLPWNFSHGNIFVDIYYLLDTMTKIVSIAVNLSVLNLNEAVYLKCIDMVL